MFDSGNDFNIFMKEKVCIDLSFMFCSHPKKIPTKRPKKLVVWTKPKREREKKSKKPAKVRGF